MSFMDSKRSFFYTTALVLLSFFFFSSSVSAEVIDIKAKAAIAIDAKSGKVFYEKNSEEQLPIASMSKLITLYLVHEAIADGSLSWDQMITIDKDLARLSQDMRLSNIPFLEGEQYSVKDLYLATQVLSANAAAIALAEEIAGSEHAFVDLMRAKVESWGIKNAYLISASGLNNEDMRGNIYPGSKKNEENLMSAKEMALVAQNLLQDYPDVLKTAKEPLVSFAKGTEKEIKMESSNLMLAGLAAEKENVDGLKTGTTTLAGACFTGTIERDGWRIITVVMNVEDGVENQTARFLETSRLMDYVYDNWKIEKILTQNQQIDELKKFPVKNGREQFVSIGTDQELFTWARKDMNKESFHFSFKPTANLLNENNELTAPIAKNEVVGKATLSLADDHLGFLDSEKEKQTISLITLEGSEKASWWKLLQRKIKSFLIFSLTESF